MLVLPSTLSHERGHVRLSLTARSETLAPAFPVFDRVLEEVDESRMLETLLTVANLCWTGDAFRSAMEFGPDVEGIDGIGTLRGQFAFAGVARGGITLIRDPLGSNKLFFAIHESGRVLVANYLVDLALRGVPCEAVYSVPAGHVIRIDLERRGLALSRYFAVERRDAGYTGLAAVGKRIRGELESWFGRLAGRFSSRKVFVCVSGGLDSGVIAALARRYFRDVTAYTYGFVEEGEEASEDARCGQRLAEVLGMGFRPVPASPENVLNAVERALLYGQDWRDFNVHCAIVNELLASAMEQDLARAGGETRALVLTGDLMNEFMADYAPVVHGGQEYYRLPRLDRESLRSFLVRGLDAGDREIGVFARHALELVQPYGLAVDVYLGLPASLVGREHFKKELGRAVAGDLLPGWIFERPKVRAQVGDSKQPRGILPVLAASGRDAGWLRRAFSELFGIGEEAFLDRFVRAGMYRSLRAFPEKPAGNGYLKG